MNTKKNLGQFYTTNYQYILQNTYIPKNSQIIEPFTGNGDLIPFCRQYTNNVIECYDIDPKFPNTIQRDTLKNPPDYTDKFVVTNPPYLSKNNTNNKEIYDFYKVDDLYKCFIVTITAQNPTGGILILPLNFFSSLRKLDVTLRRNFLQQYHVTALNIFEEPVFDDTTINVCCFQFTKKLIQKNENETKCMLFPSKKTFRIIFSEENLYMIGGEIYNLPKSTIFSRLLKDQEISTNLFVRCMDSYLNDQEPISMSLKEPFFDNTPKKTERTFMTLKSTVFLSVEDQEILALRFNEYLNDYRERYHSLFLNNFRDHRKRISLRLVFNICEYLYHKYIKK